MALAKLLKTTSVVYLCCLLNLCGCALPSYYWREYAGVAPKDALVGGRDRNGKPIYIGQILHENKLIPTKIYENDPNGYYGYLGREFTGNEAHKILCTKTPNSFKWIPTGIYEMTLLLKTLKDIKMITGGYEIVCDTFIGRSFFRSETMVGKVSVCRGDPLGLYVTSKGEEINLTSFELLTYNKTVSSDGGDV